MWAPNAGPAVAHVERRAADDRPAGRAGFGGDLGQRQRRMFAGTVQRNEPAAFPADVRHVGVPDLRGASAQLFAHVAGRLDHGHAGRVAHAAAAGDVGVPGRIGIGDRRTDALHGNAELLRHHQRLRDARAADVGVAGEHRRAAIAVERHRRARIHAGVEPEAAGKPASLIGSDRRLPVRVTPGRLEHRPSIRSARTWARTVPRRLRRLHS